MFGDSYLVHSLYHRWPLSIRFRVMQHGQKTHRSPSPRLPCPTSCFPKMLTSDIVEVVGPRPDLSFRMRLLSRENADVVKNILALLPLEGFLLHVVVAGETIYMPAPSVALDSRNMVERRKGTVYYNTTSQSICFCYGAVTESTPVNQFAQVLEEDLEHLEKLGRVVY